MNISFFWKNIDKSILLSIFAMILFSGCGTISLQTFAKSSNSIFFESLKPQKTIFLITKNSSQVDSKIGELTKENLIKKGYKIVNNPDKAQFILRINTLNLNQLQEQNTLKAAGTLGATGALVGGATSGDLKGGAVSGVVMGAAAGIFALATEDGNVKMQADVYVTEKLKDGKEKSYTTRIFAEATQMHLAAQKAQPILEKIIAKKISGIFP